MPSFIKTIGSLLLLSFSYILIIFILPIRKKFKRKPIIVCIDRIDKAGDNGEVMYHFLKNKNDYDTYFALSRKSSDWKRLQPDKHLIRLYSLRYIWIIINADVAMFSHALFMKSCIPFKRLGLKQIFLQHGVIHEDLSKIYSAECGHDLVCTATKAEYTDRLNPSYGYKPEQIALTGLPRFDLLEKKNSKVITIGFTWRKYLRKLPLKEIKKSLFFNMIHSLVIDHDFTDLAEKYGYEIQFVPHLMLNKSLLKFIETQKDNRVKINAQQSYTEILSQTALLITDYSSIAFDTAYLNTPVVYYQTDEKEFYSGKHTYLPGYFKFERDGFGNIVYDKESLLKIVEYYLKNQCKMEDFYLQRVQKTFEFFDKNNCQRVFEAAEKIMDK